MAKKDNEIEEQIDATTLDIGVELTETEKLKIEAEARSEVAKELKAQKIKEFKDAAKQRLKKQALFSDAETDADGVETITLNLAPVQPYISLDGRRYYHGRTYSAKQSVISVLKDQQFRGWKEESARLGEDMNAFYGRQKMNAAIGPAGLRRLQ